MQRNVTKMLGNRFPLSQYCCARLSVTDWSLWLYYLPVSFEGREQVKYELLCCLWAAVPCTVVRWIFCASCENSAKCLYNCSIIRNKCCKKTQRAFSYCRPVIWSLCYFHTLVCESVKVLVIPAESEFKKGINGATLVLKHRCSQRLARSTRFNASVAVISGDDHSLQVEQLARL